MASLNTSTDSPTTTRIPLTVRQIAALDDVSLVDSEHGLVMFCYDHDLDMEETDELTQECRGVVFDEDGTLVSRAFGYAPVYTVFDDGVEDEVDAVPVVNNEAKDAARVNFPGAVIDAVPVPDDIKAVINSHIKECRFYHAYEGTLIRVFYHTDRWFLTTHRKLNAFKSCWGSRTSFGDLFLKGLEFLHTTLTEFLDDLDKDLQYVFLIHTTVENRIVEAPFGYQRLSHIGTFFPNGEMAPHYATLIPSQVESCGFKNYDEVARHVLEYPMNLVVFLPNQKQIKLCYPQYLYKFNLRGNESSVMFRYLQLRNTPQLQDFMDLYYDYTSRFERYERILADSGVPPSRLDKMSGVQLNRIIRAFLKKEKEATRKAGEVASEKAASGPSTTEEKEEGADE